MYVSNSKNVKEYSQLFKIYPLVKAQSYKKTISSKKSLCLILSKNRGINKGKQTNKSYEIKFDLKKIKHVKFRAILIT